jgi:phage terminase small subunit
MARVRRTRGFSKQRANQQSGESQAQERRPLPNYITHSDLSPLEASFCYEFLADFNIAKTAVRAGLVSEEEGIEAARQAGSRLLERPHVAFSIERAMRDRVARSMVTGDKVIHEFAKIAFADPANYVDEHNNVRSISEMDPIARAAISEFTTDREYDRQGNLHIRTKVKLHDKLSALKALAPHVGLDMKGVSGEYGQFNQQNNTFILNQEDNSQHMQVDLSDLSDTELKALNKLIDLDKKSASEGPDIYELENLQDQFARQEEEDWQTA